MNYNKKYLKYKKKYLDLKNNFNQTGGVIKMALIPQYETLFRSAPVICDYNTEELIQANVKKCENTGKTGIYLSNNILVSIAMCLEYNKLLEIGEFILLKPIEISFGKYEFRELNRQKYFNDKGELKPGKQPSDDENISHLGINLKLLKMKESGSDKEVINFLEGKRLEIHKKGGLNEIFLTKDDVKKIILVGRYQFNPIRITNASDLQKWLEEFDYPLDIKTYIDNGILVKFDCPV